LPWIDFGSGNSRVLNFYSYEIVGANGLPSQPKFRLYVQFRMKGNVQIRSDEQSDGESDTLIIINARCSLSFETLVTNRHIVTINLYKQDDIRMYNGPYYFSTFINPSDAESLMHVTHGIQTGWNNETAE
jgi:hypothetical protein